MLVVVFVGIRVGNINIIDGKQFVIIMEGFGKLDIVSFLVMLFFQEVFCFVLLLFGFFVFKLSKIIFIVW